MKTVGTVLFIAAVAATMAGCGGDTGSSAPTTARAATETGAIASGMSVKEQTCQGMLVFLEGMRGLGADVDAEIRNALEQIPQRPEWATMSEAERTATLEGIRDAADGKCS